MMLSSTKSLSKAIGLKSAARALSSQPYTLPDLPYDYGALEPSVSGTIMELHHKKHHQTYITNANAAIEQYQQAEATGNMQKMISLQGAIKFNGGGHVNHSLFWENLAPDNGDGGDEPSGALKEYMDKQWGSFEAFKKEFIATSAGVQGSGWGWLAYCPKHDHVSIETTANQDPCITTGKIPLLGVDVWEHAYYLDYKNVRPDYLNAIFEVLNFKVAAERLSQAKSA